MLCRQVIAFGQLGLARRLLMPLSGHDFGALPAQLQPCRGMDHIVDCLLYTSTAIILTLPIADYEGVLR